MKVYPLRTSSNSWDINLYSSHVCTKDCKYAYIVEPLTDESSIMFIFDNPNYNITNETCQFFNTVNKTSIKLSDYDKKSSLAIDGKLMYHNQIVIPHQKITIDLKFPLKENKKIMVNCEQILGFTLSELIYTIKKVYEWIYKKEEETCTENEHTIMMLCSCNENVEMIKQNVLNESVISVSDNINKDCPICLDLIENDCLLTKCNHFYHKECILKWVEQKDNCPTCRQNLFTCDLCKGTNVFYINHKCKVIPKEMRGIINKRNTTDGIFGIYGYDMEDLYLKDMTYNSITRTLYPNIVTMI